MLSQLSPGGVPARRGPPQARWWPPLLAPPGGPRWSPVCVGSWQQAGPVPEDSELASNNAESSAGDALGSFSGT